MKPLITLAQASTSEGAEISLHRKDNHFFLRVNREPLMATNAPGSEMEMARLTCSRFGKNAAPRVLIGGLGFGFTLRQVLELAGPGAEVHVAELLSEIVAWNREFLSEVNGRLLDDPRVRIMVADVLSVISESRSGFYDAILLDVDNGPSAMVQKGNANLYQPPSLVSIFHALKPGGRVAFWSASPDRPFARRLAKAGFKVEVIAAKSRIEARRAAHTIFLGERAGSNR